MSIPIPPWTPPWPTSSTAGFVRISNTHLRPGGCAEQVARKARPDVFPDARAPWEPKGVGSFPLGLARDALVLLLGGAATLPEDPSARIRAAIDRAAQDSWDEWAPESRPPVEQAIVGYLEVLESLRAEGALPESLVFADLAVAQDPDADRVEFWAWALLHLSRDGTVREAHLLRWRSAANVSLGEAEVALIAHVAGSGSVVDHDKWWRPFEPRKGLTQPPTPATVRVRVIGMLDRSSDVRFDGTPAEAEDLFARLVPSSLELLGGGSTRPSGSCAGCGIRHVCSGIDRMPGLLGVTGYSPRTRSISPSALWTHRACPRQLHLSRDLGLPRTPGAAGPSLIRGTQVHAWLAAAHARGVACSGSDLPEGHEQSAVHTGLAWSADDYAVNRPYLLQHLGCCPFDEAGAAEVDSEVSVTAWDTDANVVFTTRPDAAYRDSEGRWVLRETKTLSPKGLPDDRTVLLERYAQAAAAICLLADGWTPDGADALPGLVELELLGPEQGEVIRYDAGDPLTVLVARTSLADRVDTWLFDTTHPIGDRPPCRTCEVFEWCEISPYSPLEEVTADLLPDVHDVDQAWAGTASDEVLRVLGRPDADEEFPF